MSVLKKLIILSLILFVSCGDTPKKEATKNNDTPQIDGVWERKGTIQFVNENPVDTLIFGKDIEGFKNIKFILKGIYFGSTTLQAKIIMVLEVMVNLK